MCAVLHERPWVEGWKDIRRGSGAHSARAGHWSDSTIPRRRRTGARLKPPRAADLLTV